MSTGGVSRRAKATRAASKGTSRAIAPPLLSRWSGAWLGGRCFARRAGGAAVDGAYSSSRAPATKAAASALVLLPASFTELSPSHLSATSPDLDWRPYGVGAVEVGAGESFSFGPPTRAPPYDSFITIFIYFAAPRALGSTATVAAASPK